MSQALAKLLKFEGINNPAVLDAIANTDRSEFLPLDKKYLAEEDHAIAIGHGQTISQPFIVARMTELLLGDHNQLNNVLEIGTGSGYQAAILSQLAKKIISIEHIQALYDEAKLRLEKLSYKNIELHFADGYLGWPDNAPYDGIIVTAAARSIPAALIDQLALHGRLIIPVGETRSYQELTLVQRETSGLNYTIFDPVVFVPLLQGIMNI